jgi:hypothetical protein
MLTCHVLFAFASAEMLMKTAQKRQSQQMRFDLTRDIEYQLPLPFRFSTKSCGRLHFPSSH